MKEKTRGSKVLTGAVEIVSWKYARVEKGKLFLSGGGDSHRNGVFTGIVRLLRIGALKKGGGEKTRGSSNLWRQSWRGYTLRG